MGTSQDKYVNEKLGIALLAFVIFGAVLIYAFHNSEVFTDSNQTTAKDVVQPVAKQIVVPKPTASSNGLVLYEDRNDDNEVTRTVFVKNVFFCVERNLIMQSAFINEAHHYEMTVSSSSTVIAKYDTEEICKSTAAKQ